MLTGLSKDLQEVSDTCKTAVIALELHRLNAGIAASQETRLLESGSLKEELYTIFWQGKGTEETWEYCIGFAAWNLLLCIADTQQMEMRFLVTTLIICRPCYSYMHLCLNTLLPPEVKDKFYESLDSTISSIPKSEALYILGDFNVRVGSDCNLWPMCLGCHGISKVNENRWKLLELSSYTNLCVTNTFYRTSHTIQCPGDTQDQITGISWTWSSPDLIPSILLATSEHTTMLTVTLIILWSSPGSNCNWNSSIGPNKKVCPASTLEGWPSQIRTKKSGNGLPRCYQSNKIRMQRNDGFPSVTQFS